MNSSDIAAGAAGSSVSGLVALVVLVIAIVAYWKVFTKAGEAGWKSIIPIYNVIVLLKIVGRPWWWLLLMLIPLVNIVVLIVVMNDLSKSFGHGVGIHARADLPVVHLLSDPGIW